MSTCTYYNYRSHVASFSKHESAIVENWSWSIKLIIAVSARLELQHMTPSLLYIGIEQWKKRPEERFTITFVHSFTVTDKQFTFSIQVQIVRCIDGFVHKLVSENGLQKEHFIQQGITPAKMYKSKLELQKHSLLCDESEGSNFLKKSNRINHFDNNHNLLYLHLLVCANWGISWIKATFSVEVS